MSGVLPALLTVVFALFSIGLLLFAAGFVYIPIGYERGRVKWFTWCSTGQHPMTVYRWTAEETSWGRPSFQSLHPADKDGDGDE